MEPKTERKAKWFEQVTENMCAVARAGEKAIALLPVEYLKDKDNKKHLLALRPQERKWDGRILAPLKLSEGNGHAKGACARPEEHRAGCRFESVSQYRERVMSPHRAIHCSDPEQHEANVKRGGECKLESIGLYRARVYADVFAQRYNTTVTVIPAFRSTARRPTPATAPKFGPDMRVFGAVKFKDGKPDPATFNRGPGWEQFSADTPPPVDPRANRKAA